MPSATVTSKGQITIPLAVRTALGLAAGDRVEFVEAGEGQYTVKAATLTVRALKGVVRPAARAVSIEDMNRSIRKRAAAQP